MSVSVQNDITGSTAVELAGSIEAAIREGRMRPGDPLPTIRSTADDLGLAPSTVAAAIRMLRERGLLVTRGRRGTAVSDRPPLPARRPAPPPRHARDLGDGNPDPSLLPDLAQSLATLDASPHLYGREMSHPGLLRLAARQLTADGIPADHLTIVSGALDGLERVLNVQLRPGDRVAVEDPAFTSVLDLLPALGLTPVPVAIDDSGPLPEALAAALKSRVQALIVTPRAQNPTGAALDEERVRELRRVLCDYPDVLVFEDDHAGPVAGARAHTLCDAGRARWAVARSVSKSLGPDLRLAFLAGDATTIARVEGRTGIGMRWVSHLLQRLVLAVSRQRGIAQQLRRAERTYSERRSALIDALAAHGIDAHGRSGLNVWIPVPDEGEAIAGLLERGWAVTSGARFRIDTPPAIRICIARLAPADAESLADDLAQVLASTARSAPV